jgi:hypothetical protein
MPKKTAKAKKAKPKKKIGRPTKLTVKTKKDIMGILRLGLSERTAQEFIGVNHSTFERWKNNNKTFATSIKRASASAKIKMTTALVNKIVNDNNLTAIIFWLKTRSKHEFNERPYDPEQESGEGKEYDTDALVKAMDSITELQKNT